MNRRYDDAPISREDQIFVSHWLAKSREILGGVEVIDAGACMGNPLRIGVRQALDRLDTLEKQQALTEDEKQLKLACEICVQDINNWYRHHKNY